MSADIIKFRRPSARKRRTKKELPPRPLHNAARLAVVMAEAAEHHLDRYLKRPIESRLKVIRWCHNYAISELRRAIEAHEAGDGDSAA